MIHAVNVLTDRSGDKIVGPWMAWTEWFHAKDVE